MRGPIGGAEGGAVSDTAFIAGRKVSVATTSNSRRQESDIRRHRKKFSPLGDLLHCWVQRWAGSDVLECAVGLNLVRTPSSWNDCTARAIWAPFAQGPKESTERRVGRSQQTCCQSQLLCCARVHVCLCGGDGRHVTGPPNRSVVEH